MDTAELVKPDVQLGMDFAAEVRKNKYIDADVALWWYDASADKWRYVLATNYVHRHGLQGVYLKVAKILDQNNWRQRLPLERVWVVPPTHPIPSNLRTTKVQPGASVELVRNRVGRLDVEHAIVYLAR